MEDAQIIELFFARSEDAISELDKKYGKLCHKLADNILASAQDAEECVNDAYLSTWNAIPPQRPESLPAFVGTLVRRCSITRYRANTAMKRNSHYDMCMEELETFLASPQQAMEEHYAARELAAAIERFLDTQSKENRVLFMRRYWYADSFAEIGKLLGITEGNALPDGYTLDEDMSYEDSGFRQLCYRSGDDLILFSYIYMQDDSFSYYDMGEDTKISEVTVNGCKGKFFLASDESLWSTLEWIDEESNLHFSLDASGDEAVLRALAESVAVTEKTVDLSDGDEDENILTFDDIEGEKLPDEEAKP